MSFSLAVVKYFSNLSGHYILIFSLRALIFNQFIFIPLLVADLQVGSCSRNRARLQNQPRQRASFH